MCTRLRRTGSSFGGSPRDTVAGRPVTATLAILDRYGNLTDSTATAAVRVGRRRATKPAVRGVVTLGGLVLDEGGKVHARGVERGPPRRSEQDVRRRRRRGAEARLLDPTADDHRRATSATITVRRQDAFGNVVVAGSTTITLAGRSSGAFRNSSDNATVRSVTIRAGHAKAGLGIAT